MATAVDENAKFSRFDCHVYLLLKGLEHGIETDKVSFSSDLANVWVEIRTEDVATLHESLLRDSHSVARLSAKKV